MQDELTWQECVALAPHFLAIRREEIYLYQGQDAPWEYATSLRAGGSHRLDMDTAVQFTAAHPCGLTFRWTLDLETREADSKGYYSIATAAIQRVIPRLPLPVRQTFLAFLAVCAEKVAARGQEYARLAARQKETAAELYALSGLPCEESP